MVGDKNKLLPYLFVKFNSIKLSLIKIMLSFLSHLVQVQESLPSPF